MIRPYFTLKPFLLYFELITACELFLIIILILLDNDNHSHVYANDYQYQPIKKEKL